MLRIKANEAQKVIMDGGVIAYPTEAVYGLGCDPDNDDAIDRLLALKKRPWEKGLILVAANIEQLKNYVDVTALSYKELEFAHSKWPGPFTFIMPAPASLSKKVRGNFNSVAVRVSSHSTVRDLCLSLGKPLISTSANLTGMKPAMTEEQIKLQFAGSIDACIIGELGEQTQPSTIIDAKSGAILRQG